MSATPQRSSRAHWLGVAGLALALAMAVVSWVTMRSVPQEWDVPSYGFPLPAFGWTGVSSGVWWLALGPLVVDLAVALLVTVPAAYLALRRMQTRWALGTGMACVVAMLLLQVPLVLGALLGVTKVRLWHSDDWPVECRSLWLGAPDGTLDWEDETDLCVAKKRARL